MEGSKTNDMSGKVKRVNGGRSARLEWSIRGLRKI